ncbi:MAG: DUF1761 domain-containing protein [Jiangellaceae bacterium]
MRGRRRRRRPTGVSAWTCSRQCSKAELPTPRRGDDDINCLELVRSLVVAMVLAWLAVGIDITDWAGAVGPGLAAWIAFPVVLLTGSVIHENVPWKLAAIHAGDWPVKLVVVTVIVSLWR